MPGPGNDAEKITWKCSSCGYTMAQQVPPSTCPSCGVECEFLNVTCYTPDCGGPGSGNFDPTIAKKEGK